jgi:hypothetical protein
MAELKTLGKLEGKFVNSSHSVRKLPVSLPEGNLICNYLYNCTINHRCTNSSVKTGTKREQDGYY